MKIESVTQNFFENPPPELLPEGMETFCEHHFQSTLYDNAIELAGKICYDSTCNVKSRSSHDYHKHINELGHTSVQRHAAFAVELAVTTPYEVPLVYKVCANRPGVWVEDHDRDGHKVWIIANICAIREWDKFSKEVITAKEHLVNSFIKYVLVETARSHAPLAMQDVPKCVMPHIDGLWCNEKYPISFGCVPYRKNWYNSDITIPHPIKDYVHVSFYIGGVSRNLTHELIRHGYSTAISQRSTRYVDESETPFVDHPLISEYGHGGIPYDIHTMSRECYQHAYKHLYSKQIDKGIDAHTARKQARGAARQYLLSSLETQLILTATFAQWKRIIEQRDNPAADAEIRELAHAVRQEFNVTKDFRID